MTIFQSILLGFLVVCAISVSFSRNLLNSILIYMSYSLIMSILWVCLESPDLAITEAAAIDADKPSPFTISLCGVLTAYRSPWSRLPSTRANSAWGLSESTAICMALMRLLRILISSISPGSTQAMAHATACSSIIGRKMSRRFSVNFLESLSHGWEKSSGNITAAA